jgi:hypothetical protein
MSRVDKTSSARVGVIGEVREFRCARCEERALVCPACDHGQVYCAGDCRAIRRRESVRRAGAKYQGSPVGARKHAARQRQWANNRAQKVTHHGFHPGPPEVMVPTSAHAIAADAEERHGAV